MIRLYSLRGWLRLGMLLPVFAYSQASSSGLSSLKPLKVVLVGDSTVADEGGWGSGFCSKLMAPCVNLAANGRSTKSFIAEGRWQKALQEKAQFYLIQFGHNDQKPAVELHTDAEGAFKENLHRFIAEVRKEGGDVILVTPLSRRNYMGTSLVFDGLEKYAQSVREVSAEDHAPCVDLYLASRVYLEKLTQNEADAFDAVAHRDAAAESPANSQHDRTHLNDRGKIIFGDMVAEGIRINVPALRHYVKFQ